MTPGPERVNLSLALTRDRIGFLGRPLAAPGEVSPDVSPDVSPGVSPGVSPAAQLGWRLFRLLDDGRLGGPLSSPLGYRRGPTITAICLRSDHQPPGRGCSCGVYYTRERAELRGLVGLVPADRRIYARVRVHGRSLPDQVEDTWWRAGALTVTSLHTESGTWLEPRVRNALIAAGWPADGLAIGWPTGGRRVLAHLPELSSARRLLPLDDDERLAELSAYWRARASRDRGGLWASGSPTATDAPARFVQGKGRDWLGPIVGGF